MPQNKRESRSTHQSRASLKRGLTFNANYAVMRRKLELSLSLHKRHSRLWIQKHAALFSLSFPPKLGQKSTEQKLWLCASLPPTHQPQKLSLQGGMVQTSNKLLHRGSKRTLFNQRDNAKAQEGTTCSELSWEQRGGRWHFSTHCLYLCTMVLCDTKIRWILLFCKVTRYNYQLKKKK